MNVYEKQESIIKPLPREYPIGFIRINSDVVERVDKKGDEEFITYVYTSTDYTLSEYCEIQDKDVIVLSTENTRLWDTVSYLLKVTEQIPTEEITS